MIKHGYIYSELIGRIQTSVHSPISDPFVIRLRDTYAALPVHIRHTFEIPRKDKVTTVQISLGKKHTDTNLNWCDTEPASDSDPRTHYDQMGGSTSSSMNWDFEKGAIICLAEYILPESAQTNAEENYVPADNVEGTMRHELGHAFNIICGDLSGNYKFKEAFLNDIESLGGIQAANAGGLGYLVQDGSAQEPGIALLLSRLNLPSLTPETLLSSRGREEIFAEAWAHHHGGGCIPSLNVLFPHSFAYVEKMLGRMETKLSSVSSCKDIETATAWASAQISPDFVPDTDEEAEMRIQDALAYLGRLRNNHLISRYHDFIDLVKATGGVQTNNLIRRLSANLREFSLHSDGTDFAGHVAEYMEAEGQDPTACRNLAREVLDGVYSAELRQAHEELAIAIPSILKALKAVNKPDLAKTFEETIANLRKHITEGYAEFAIVDFCRICARPSSMNGYDIPIFVMQKDYKMPYALIHFADHIRKHIRPDNYRPTHDTLSGPIGGLVRAFTNIADTTPPRGQPPRHLRTLGRYAPKPAALNKLAA